MTAHLVTYPAVEFAKEIRVRFPALLLDELNRQVPAQERDSFITESVQRELRRLRLLNAVARLRDQQAWTDAYHPELVTIEDVDAYVDTLRERPSSYSQNTPLSGTDE